MKCRKLFPKTFSAIVPLQFLAANWMCVSVVCNLEYDLLTNPNEKSITLHEEHKVNIFMVSELKHCSQFYLKIENVTF